MALRSVGLEGADGPRKAYRVRRGVTLRAIAKEAQLQADIDATWTPSLGMRRSSSRRASGGIVIQLVRFWPPVTLVEVAFVPPGMPTPLRATHRPAERSTALARAPCLRRD